MVPFAPSVQARLRESTARPEAKASVAMPEIFEPEGLITVVLDEPETQRLPEVSKAGKKQAEAQG